MNRIYWHIDKIGMITDQLNADMHTHWMQQLFLSLDGTLELELPNENVVCSCIVVDKNIPHSFRSNNKLGLSILIEPTSSIAGQLSTRMNGNGCWVCDREGMEEVQQKANEMFSQNDMEQYLRFISEFFEFLSLTSDEKQYDSRIMKFLTLLENCACESHAIAAFAEEISLSPSRLSHLFKEQTGVPLKSYLSLHQMERAFECLLNGGNITEAAMGAGYDSPSHFAAAVKKTMGIPASLSIKDSEFLKVLPL